MNIDYTLWPNTDGNLGDIKVPIPTGIGEDKWPEGDALIKNFIYKDGKLVGFVDNKALIVNESKTTTIDYDYCDIELPFAAGEMHIKRGPYSKYFKVRYTTTANGEEGGLIRFENIDEDTKTLLRSAVKIIDNTLYDVDDNAIGTFDTSKLATGTNIIIGALFEPPYSSDGKEMDGLFACLDANGAEFIRELPLTIFNSSLKSLTNGNLMFAGCPYLMSFEGDLSSLTHAYAMFGACFGLTSFKSNLSSLISALMMFTQSQFLASFEADLSSLKNGSYMFTYCFDLTSFKSNLSSLTNGYEMFQGCSLNTESVQLIADTINDVNSLTDSDDGPGGDIYKEITIGIANSTPNEQEEAAFQQMAAKGWTVLASGETYNAASPAAIITLDENGEENTTPIPFYAKPIPATERTANYVDANGNYFDIVGGQFIYGDDLSTYGMFTCEADAAANMRLTKIEKPQMLSVNR